MKKDWWSAGESKVKAQVVASSFGIPASVSVEIVEQVTIVPEFFDEI